MITYRRVVQFSFFCGGVTCTPPARRTGALPSCKYSTRLRCRGAVIRVLPRFVVARRTAPTRGVMIAGAGDRRTGAKEGRLLRFSWRRLFDICDFHALHVRRQFDIAVTAISSAVDHHVLVCQLEPSSFCRCRFRALTMKKAPEVPRASRRAGLPSLFGSCW